MDAAQTIAHEIVRFTAESAANRHADGSGPYFDAPWVGIASAFDPLFDEYKRVVGSFHWTPREVFDDAFGSGSFAAGSVVVWVLPIAAHTRQSNRRQQRLPSRPWARTRQFGETFNQELRRHTVAVLESAGHRAVAPFLAPNWRMVHDERVGLASTWSERHAAYAAGLGTFSLSDGFITAAGIAHRLGSVVTDAVLPPTERTAPDHLHHCLFYREGTCGACIPRCPVGAITQAGHDKELCRQHVYGTVPREAGETYGLTELGCGLCQTGVPCEGRIPASQTR